MRARLGQIAQNVALSAASLAVCFAMLELVVFRFVLVPDDLLANVSINGAVRYRPGTEATFRHPDGSRTHVTINADGWNSTKPSYPLARTPGKRRIAVVGDSYVHGAFVDTADGFPEIAEAELRRVAIDAEVFRFGMDGAPLSQYLHVLRREVRNYKPDVVVVSLIHNDFDESWRFLKTRYASSFMKIGRAEDGRPLEIPPAEFEAGSADLFRQFATFRYLYYETNAHLRLKSLVSRHFWGGNEEWKDEFISSAVDIRKIADHEQNRFATRYVLTEMKKLAVTEGFALLFVMDGVREAIYAGEPRSEWAVSQLNALAAEVTTELGLPFLDLQETFAADFAVHRTRFEYPFDWHWNKHANRLVGMTIARRLAADPAISGPPAVQRQAATVR